MLSSTDANAPQSGRMNINAPLSNKTDTYLGTGYLPENNNSRFQGSSSGQLP